MLTVTLQAFFKNFEFSAYSRDLQQPLSKWLGCVTSLPNLKNSCGGCAVVHGGSSIQHNFQSFKYFWDNHYWEIAGMYCNCCPREAPEKTSPLRISRRCAAWEMVGTSPEGPPATYVMGSVTSGRYWDIFLSWLCCLGCLKFQRGARSSKKCANI